MMKLTTTQHPVKDDESKSFHFWVSFKILFITFATYCAWQYLYFTSASTWPSNMEHTSDFPVKQLPYVNNTRLAIHATQLHRENATITLSSSAMRTSLEMNAWRKQCGLAKHVEFIIPHVNKAGGRSFTATFGGYQTHQLRELNQRPRSAHPGRTYGTYNSHRHWLKLLEKTNCSSTNNIEECEITTPELCRRWVFMLREPIARTLSAFYTQTGRRTQYRQPKVPEAVGPAHFSCINGRDGAAVLANESATIEDWASLPSAQRRGCYLHTANLHVKYLAPEYPPDSTLQFQVALKRLQQLSWFGILEKSMESIQLLSYTFGLDLELYTPVSNVNQYEKNIPKWVLKTLVQMNRLDIRLYKAAAEMFEKRWQDFVRNDPNSTDHIPFQCDASKVCWHKRNYLETWLPETIPSNFTVAQRKRNILCASPIGCQRNLTISLNTSRGIV